MPQNTYSSVHTESTFEHVHVLCPPQYTLKCTHKINVQVCACIVLGHTYIHVCRHWSKINWPLSFNDKNKVLWGCMYSLANDDHVYVHIPQLHNNLDCRLCGWSTSLLQMKQVWKLLPTQLFVSSGNSWLHKWWWWSQCQTCARCVKKQHGIDESC